MNQTDAIINTNCLPGVFIQAAQIHFPETTFYGVMLEITDLCRLLSTAELGIRWFSEEELHKHSSFKLEKRRNEWLSGRICAKLAAAQMQDISTQHVYREIVVVNAPGGRPSLQVQGEDKSGDFDLSISHSGNLALALIASDFCGVDIQETNETLLRVKERFCTTNDEESLRDFFKATPSATELNFLWSAKEAIRKALSYVQVPDFMALNLVRVELISKDLFIFHFSYKDQTIRTICTPYTNYCLAFCIHKGSANAGTS